MGDVVALYCRISVDRNGRRESVAAQEKWGRAYAADHWPGVPIRVFVDNDLSAARDDVRPGYDELIEAVKAGEITRLWCVEQSRLERREGPWFELAALLDLAGMGELHTRRDGIIRVRDDVAGIKAVINAGEIRRLKQRLNDKLDSIAELGCPPGGVAYGYRRTLTEDGVKTFTIIPEQAEVIRWAADAVLRGWSLTNIAAELAEQGHHGARGFPISRMTVRSMLSSHAVAGRRLHRGVDTGPGNWEPILSMETWRAVQRKLSTPRTVTRSDGGEHQVSTAFFGRQPGRRYVLTGLVHCGVCDSALVGVMKTMAKKRRNPYLLCAPHRGGNACVGIQMEPTEEFVLDELFRRLDHPEFLQAIAEDEHAARRDGLAQALDDVEARRIELTRLWARGERSNAEWQAARDVLEGEQRTLQAQLAAVPPPVIGVDIDGAREAWPEMTLDEQREFVRIFIAKITIDRWSKPGVRRFDSDRIAIEWQLTNE